MDDYKTAKEAFVSGMTGSTVSHVNLISCVALASIALYSTLQTRVYGARDIPFLLSWLLLTMPLLLSMTLFANKPVLLAFLLLVPAALIYARSSSSGGTMLPGSVAGARKSGSSITPLPALSTYRAHMMLMTVLGILAVDFPVFPRALAKCESYGVSLMDLGVGSFVFSNGLVSAIPLLKNPRYLQAPLLPKVGAVLWKALPIVALGVVRVLLVKGTEYPEHETEYGTHWNFFITLALLPVLQVFLHPLIRLGVVPLAFIGVGVGLLQQLALSRLGLKDYVKFAPRLNLATCRYTSLVFPSGPIVLPPTPKFFPRLIRQRVSPADLAAPRQNDKTAIELASYSIVWWAALGAVRLLGMDEGVSRQTANFPYVLWIAAFNTSFILGYIVPKQRATAAPAPATSYFSPDPPEPVNGISSPVRAPPLLEALNKNGLPVFLLANVGTGVVNLSMRTIYAGAVVSMSVLSLYSLVVCGAAWALRGKKLW
ncbi:GWT1-domain-containing protein [Mycena amicta]|nr:GWT1-domain-containing protein [Mycena amicta]